jgi:hypothetical protein
VKITRSQLKKFIKEEINTISEMSDDSSEIENPSEFWGWNDADDRDGPLSNVETNMAADIARNEDEIMNSRALSLAQKIAHLFPQAGLGSVSEEELPILARHLLAVKAELDPLKPWNK